MKTLSRMAYGKTMKTLSRIESSLDRFEGEGGALARQQTIPAAHASLGAPENLASWHVRPAFLSELSEILDARDRAEAEHKKQRNALGDRSEDFAQRFQELIDTQILPQFESVAALLSKRFYPVEVRVAGTPEERVCFLAVSSRKCAGGWAAGAPIEGPRMVFRSDSSAGRVVYTVATGAEAPHLTERDMEIKEVTDTFLEQELRDLILLVSGTDPATARQRVL